MNDYIAKPVDERLLYSKIMSATKKPSLAQSNGDSQNGQNQEIKKCVNLDYLKKRTKSNPDLMMNMISLYLEHTPPLVKSLKQGTLKKLEPFVFFCA